MSAKPIEIPSDFETATGLAISREIGRSAKSVVYLAWRDSQPYAVKVPLPHTLQADAESLWLQFRREASVLARFQHPSLPRVAAVGLTGEVPYLVTDYIEGTPLSDLYSEHPLAEDELCRIAKALLGALDEIHRTGMIHRDIKPQNILVKENLDPVLIDFGLAMNHRFHPKEGEVVGTLRYCPPEQSGIVKRPVDRRSDLYSLGVVLYECATGKPPFFSSDAGQLIQLHATKDPVAISKIVPDFSPTLERIILKLLAKDPDDRYQTAKGALRDIMSLAELDARHKAGKNVALGRHDRLEGQVYIGNLIGRRKELESLRAAWQRARAGASHGILVQGESGSGKTRLIHEALKFVNENHGLVLTAKCPQKNQIPFGPLREAIDAYCERVRHFPETEQQEAKALLARAAGENPSVLSAFSKSLADMLQTDQPAFELESQEQLYATVANFLSGLARASGGTCLFIDDVQWLDEASYRVLRRLDADRNRSPLLRLYVARTDSESAGPCLDQLRREVAKTVDIVPLDEGETGALIREQFGGRDVSTELIHDIYVRSKGNPFAVGEYIQAVLDTGLIRPFWNEWLLDVSAFSHLALPDDLIQLIVRRIEDLDKTAQDILAVAAVIGQKKLFHILPAVCELDPMVVQRAIAAAAEAHLIERRRRLEFSFVHDKIQEALVSTLTASRRRSVHQRIADALDAIGGSERGAEHVYALAQHAYLGEHDTSAESAYRANFLAGRLALGEYAVKEAYVFFRQTEELARTAHVQLDLEFFKLRAEACILTGRAEEAISYLLKAIELTESPLLRAKVRITLARVYITIRQIGKTWEALYAAFEELGYRQSSSKFIHLLRALRDWACAVVLLRFPRPTTCPETRDRLRTLVQCYEVAMQAAYFKGDLAFLLYGFQSLYPALRIGVSRELSFAYSLYGINFALIRRSAPANMYADRALEVAERTGDHLTVARAKVWKAVLKNLDGRWEEAEALIDELMQEDTKIDATDYLNLCGCRIFQAVCNGYPKKSLETIHNGVQRLSLTQAQFGLTVQYHPYFAYQLLSLPLLGRNKDVSNFIRQCRAQIEQTPEDRFGAGLFYSALTGFFYESGDLGENVEEAIRNYKKVDRNHPSLTTLHTKHFYVYQAYVRMEQCIRAESDRKYHMKLLKQAVSELAWATLTPNCPSLVAHLRVLEAALAHLSGRTKKALALLNRAENAATMSDCALARFEALRLRARIYAKLGRVKASIQEADLAHSFAQERGWLFRTTQISLEFNVHINSSTTKEQPSQNRHDQTGNLISELRIRRYEGALLRVSLAVGGKLELEEQASSALDELIRALGAERAFIFEFTEETGKLSLVIGKGIHGERLSDLEGYSRTVVERVMKTKQPVLLTADESGEAISSESILRQNLRSIVAVPMLLEKHFGGVLYLDNRLVRGVFNSEDLDLLQAIGNQIAAARRSARMALHIFKENELRNNLHRFLPREVVRDIMAGTLKIDETPKNLAVTVLFSDLVDFTKMLNNISAYQSNVILNDYLNRMINTIFRHGGTINKFMGDALMVIFGAPLEIPAQEQVERAVGCAHAMQESLLELNEGLKKIPDIEELKMRIGIHHGPVLIGKFGNERRMEYTAFGNTVNVASRIQSVCPPGKVYFSKVVSDFLPGRPVRKAGSFELKGLGDRINLYEVDSDAESADEASRRAG